MVHRRQRLALVLLLAAAASPALAGAELTPHFGVRFGGEVDAGSTADASIDASPAYGLTLDVPLAPDKGVTVLWSRQDSEADVSALLPGESTIDLTLDYLQVGTFYRPDSGKGFVMASVGLTRAEVDRSGFDGDLGFSAMAGGGAIFPIGKRLSFRLEGRGYFTFDEVKLDGVCGGVGCSVRIAGAGALQFDALAGLTIRF